MRQAPITSSPSAAHVLQGRWPARPDLACRRRGAHGQCRWTARGGDDCAARAGPRSGPVEAMVVAGGEPAPRRRKSRSARPSCRNSHRRWSRPFPAGCGRADDNRSARKRGGRGEGWGSGGEGGIRVDRAVAKISSSGIGMCTWIGITAGHAPKSTLIQAEATVGSAGDCFEHCTPKRSPFLSSPAPSTQRKPRPSCMWHVVEKWLKGSGRRSSDHRRIWP